MTEKEHQICQVCGDELQGHLVWCANCSTPQHGDCWQSYGCCSTYGCGSKKALDEHPSYRNDDKLIIIENEDLATAADENFSEKLIYIIDDEEKRFNQKLRSRLVKESERFCRAVAFLTRPAHSFWILLYESGPKVRQDSIIRAIFGEEMAGTIKSTSRTIVLFLFIMVLVFVHIGPQAGYVLLSYLSVGAFAHLLFLALGGKATRKKRTNAVAPSRLVSSSHSSRPPKRKKKWKRSKRRKHRRKKKNRRR